MDGDFTTSSSSSTSMQRQSNKRSHSIMSASHEHHHRDTNDSAFAPRDSHYDNEHASQRRRLFSTSPWVADQVRLQDIVTSPWGPGADSRVRERRFVGDGLDFRRPVMSSSAASAGAGAENGRGESGSGRSTAVNVIDLTDEDGLQEASQDITSQNNTAAGGSTSRAHRLPRFGRDVIDLESSTSDEDEDDGEGGNQRPNLNLLGNNYLALPNGRPRPQFSSLRRPARLPSPPTDMEDVEFLEERPRRRTSVRSRQPTPAVRSLRQRSATPYPTVHGETIDLTEDNDDDIVLLTTRRREGGGLNNDGPAIPPRTIQDRGYEQMAHVANLLREGGANLGGRLMQRLQDVAGFDPVFHVPPAGHHHHHHNHHHRGNQDRNQNGHRNPDVYRPADQPRPPRPPRPLHRRTARVAPPGLGIGLQQQMPGLMDYTMAAFDLGAVGGGHRPPTPKYTPPPPPEKGFTRSPDEDEVVVCPNCGDELAVAPAAAWSGGERERKAEVWVVKSCGHAYCGDCVHNRSRGSSKKGKGKAPAVDGDDATLPPPFKKCVVPGCGKQLNAKSMVHVFLGT